MLAQSPLPTASQEAIAIFLLSSTDIEAPFVNRLSFRSRGSSLSPTQAHNARMHFVMTNRYHIWTEGCQMNVADSAKLAAGLDRFGWRATAAPQAADLVVLHT